MLLKSTVLAALLMGAGLSPAFALAQTEEPRQFSSRVGTPVAKAAEALGADEFQAGLSVLDSALGLENLTDYERANIQKMRGMALYNMDNLPGAIAAFQDAIKSGGLTEPESGKLFEQIAQLKIANGEFTAGAKMLEDWAARAGELTPKHQEMLMNAWVQAEQYSKALPWAEKWFEAAKRPERKHFDMLNYLYSNLTMPEAQIRTIKSMIKRWPEDRQLWGNWISLLAYNGHDDDAFEVNRIMYLGGMLTTESGILKLVQYHGYYGVPYQGAQILEREMNAGRVTLSAANLKNLATLYRQARAYDRAIPILRKAAELAGDKTVYAELAEALINANQCAEAETAFGQAIDLGYPSGKPWMLIGTCRYEAAQTVPKPSCDMSKEDRAASDRTRRQNAASGAFGNVSAPAGLRRDARQWQSFIRAEQRAVEDRCDFIRKLYVDGCFAQFQRAYGNIVLTQGKLVMEDETCLTLKPDYDAKYRPHMKMAVNEPQAQQP